jgi:hypothetical protein
MRSSTILAFIFMCFVCAIAKTAKDEDFSEFDDFDHDEFVDGMCLVYFDLFFSL